MKRRSGTTWLGLVVVSASASLAGTGCKKKGEIDQASATAPGASADRLADGKRLVQSVAHWTQRWSDVESLPSCENFEDGDVQSCASAQEALMKLKKHLAENEPHGDSLRAVAELALSAERANEKLIAVLGAKREEVDSETAHGRAASGGNAVAQEYGRVSRLALRHLSVYLQFGPLPIRRAAFTEYERLSKERPVWPALIRSLREASLVENDAALAQKLKLTIAQHDGTDARRTIQAAAPGRNVARDVTTR